MKKCVKSTHMKNKPILIFMREEEIIAAEEKGETILNYFLSDSNTINILLLILNYETKKGRWKETLLRFSCKNKMI